MATGSVLPSGGLVTQKLQGGRRNSMLQNVLKGIHKLSKGCVQTCSTDDLKRLGLKPPKKYRKNPYHKQVPKKGNDTRRQEPRCDNGGVSLKNKAKLFFANDWKSDLEWHGRELNEKKPHLTRMWLQNPNGISAHDMFRIFRGDLEDVIDANVDFLALPESKLNSNNKYVMDQLKMITENHSSNVKLCHTNTKKYCQGVMKTAS